MGDVTPLPSPLLASDSPGPWKKEGFKGRLPSRDGAPSLQTIPSQSVLVSTTGESISAALAHQNKRKAYASLGPSALGAGRDEDGESTAGTQKMPHNRNRSLSEYTPDHLQLPKRMITVSGGHIKTDMADDEPHMRREPHLSEARGLTPIEKPPTPPPSESSIGATDSLAAGSGTDSASKKSGPEFFEATGVQDQKRRRWMAIRPLGQGTFSRVVLATSQTSPNSDGDEADMTPTTAADGASTSDSQHLPPNRRNLVAIKVCVPEPETEAEDYDRRSLVAVKVCEHGPRGGASEDRIEMSLKRELELMQSVHHPSIVHLKASAIEPSRALLVLSYCPGGDLFDIASQHRDVLTAPLLRRIFSELIGAVSYLHARHIVHRDIKLENVLVNLPPSELASTSTDWQTYPYSVVTLTDLGLSRRIADDERLETRCGSDDYAAPEVIMGQAYDGRATDAWSLGVLLYALLEARLPFDPHPGAVSAAGGTGTDAYLRLRSRTSHRIARVEWRWIEYAGEDGDHEGSTEAFGKKGLLGAMEVAEGLLRRTRTRWGLEKVMQTEWVSQGVQVEGGAKFHPEDEAEEVL
jgi:protein-serine/threonine kinase